MSQALLTLSVNNEKMPKHSHRHRLRAAMLNFPETGASTSLPGPLWKRAPPLLIAHGQVVAVPAAGLGPCGRGCIHYANKILHDAAVFSSRTYHSVRKCKEHLIFLHMLEPFL